LGIGLFSPLLRRRTDLLREGAHRDRDLDPLRREEGQLVFPVQTSRRYRRVGQPVECDVVDDILSRQALGDAVEHPRDLPIGPDVVIEDPRGQADRRILDSVQGLRPVPHLQGIAETMLVEEGDVVERILLLFVQPGGGAAPAKAAASISGGIAPAMFV
jgi:hypothetical protein